MTAPDTAEALAEVLTVAILRHVTSVTNLPDWMQVPALGRDMRPLAEGIVAALLDSGVLDAVKIVALREAADEWDRLVPALAPNAPGVVARWLLKCADSLARPTGTAPDSGGGGS